jgi:hypothetical protein
MTTGPAARNARRAFAVAQGRPPPLLLADLESPGANPGAAFRWLQMLNQGDRLFATANSDAHVTKPKQRDDLHLQGLSHRIPSPVHPEHRDRANHTAGAILPYGRP